MRVFRRLRGHGIAAVALHPGRQVVLAADQEPDVLGDHATNIAENVWFLVRGEDNLPPRVKRDGSNTVAP